jgi:hypothetical protein
MTCEPTRINTIEVTAYFIILFQTSRINYIFLAYLLTAYHMLKLHNVKQDMRIIGARPIHKEKASVAYFIVGTAENNSSAKVRGLCSGVSNRTPHRHTSHIVPPCQPAISPIKGMRNKRDGKKSSSVFWMHEKYYYVFFFAISLIISKWKSVQTLHYVTTASSQILTYLF